MQMKIFSPNGINRLARSAKKAFQQSHFHATVCKRNVPISSRTTNADKTPFNSSNTGFETLSIHAGTPPDPSTGARAPSICASTAFVFNNAEHAANLFGLKEFGNIYSRLTNPTVGALESRLAALEGGSGATCTASGHAAQILALFPLMQPGDKLIASKKLYGGTVTQFGKTIQKFGWTAEFVDMDDQKAVAAAVAQENVKAIWAESLANPGGIVTDIEALSAIAKQNGVPLIIDNTLATSYLCKPFEYGADVVVYSTTKFLGGHGNAVGGAVIESGKFDWAQNDKFPSLTQPDPAYHGLNFNEVFGPMNLAYTVHGHAVGLRDLGCTMSPMTAFQTLTALETLGLRMDRHAENAQAVADYLKNHKKVAWISYCGDKKSPYHALAKKYLKKGYGSIFTFGLKGGYEAGVKLVDSVQLFSHVANIGDTRSLIIHSASTTHSQLTPEQRKAAGAGDDVIRLSIGLETVDDLIRDLDLALEAV